MLDIHHCQYRGTAFYVEKQKVVEIFVESRVVVDAACFREDNPNEGWPYENEYSEKSSPLVKSNGLDPLDVKGEDLFICSPTVPGFSLVDKR